MGTIRGVAAQVVRPSVRDVTVNDGVRCEIDLETEQRGEVFEPLRDSPFFAQAMLRPVIGTIVWPNEADFSPEFLSSDDERNPYLNATEEASANVGERRRRRRAGPTPVLG